MFEKIYNMYVELLRKVVVAYCRLPKALYFVLLPAYCLVFMIPVMLVDVVLGLCELVYTAMRYHKKPIDSVNDFIDNAKIAAYETCQMVYEEEEA